jgi:hypothetical protein
VDTTFNWRGTLNYNLGIPSDKVSFILFKNYRIGWFPSTFNNSFTLSSSEPQSYNWKKEKGFMIGIRELKQFPPRLLLLTIISAGANFRHFSFSKNKYRTRPQTEDLLARY